MTYHFPELEKIKEQLLEIRHDIHAHPELSMTESRTASVIARQLSEWGIEDVTTGVGKYGIVAVIHGAKPGPMIALRADFDALPIEEKTGLPWASTNKGVMHACGHDGHATMLLGACWYLNQIKETFSGSVACVFQPGEEAVGGVEDGAKKMVRDGLFTRWPISEIYGQHQYVPFQTGTFGVRFGYMLAATDFFTITVHGKGSHGAFPQGAIDPLIVGQHVVSALQTIVSRNVPATEAAVVTVGGFTSGSLLAGNVIPDEATMRGTVRTFDPKIRERVISRMNAICDGMSVAFECQVKLDYQMMCPSLFNQPELAQSVADILKHTMGEDCVRTDLPLWMGGEDFAYMLNERPGCFIRLGNSDETHTANGHNPLFDFNDKNLLPGATALAAIALGRLKALSAV